MIASAFLLQVATFLGGSATQDEAAATVAAIGDYCLPVASAGASGRPAPTLASAADVPARLRYPLDATVPRHWGDYRAVSVPARDGQVWVVAFGDGRCMVRAWGNVLVPVSQAVHALFDAAPWQRDPGGTGWTATFRPAKGPSRTVAARYTGEQVDNIDVQGDAVILLTPATPIGEDNGPTFRTRHP